MELNNMMRFFSSPPTRTPRKRKFMLALPAPNLMPDLDEYMTTKEAAQELGFTLPGIHHLIKKSKLEYLAVGRVFLVTKKSVSEYLDMTKGMSKNDPTRGKIAEK
jgi:excisionase family DNA binding protein